MNTPCPPSASPPNVQYIENHAVNVDALRKPPPSYSSTPSIDEQYSRPNRLSVPLSKSSTTTTLANSPLEKQERVNVRLASAFVIFFVFGWGDGVTGTLLPHFKADFHLSFMTSSLCFVASTVGFALGTTLVERILGLAGWVYIRPNQRSPILPAFLRRAAKGGICGYSASQARFIVTWTGTLVHPVFFIIMGCRRNFASMLVAYVISAFSRSLLTANMNHYVASTPKKALGYMYGFWSIGSMCAPLVCQSVIATGISWSHFYFGSLVLSGISSSFAFYAFHPSATEVERDVLHRREEGSISQGTVPREKETGLPQNPDSEATIGLPELSKDASAPSKTLLRGLKTPLLWALVLFLGIYTGTEAGTQGFIVTYLLGVRNANPNTVGYSTSGFWGGQAVSRFIWGYINLR
ncbi:major facilitator superfamily domain-containing protein [Irpex rosettiformis]|uniref:Major facilitator superfamily domain-containing protein n=1 Tax=Irpex rosettiformis TaxID=378272 RepID=A0ACB8TUM3_9APHY|nr:major facilitator superfamily domain-containing protein [Irpex rosettiformis]